MTVVKDDQLLGVRDISLSFRGIHAITELSFDIARGEICSLIGPNGAGKSSLLNLINGVYWPDSGQIMFDGRSFSRLRAIRQPSWASREHFRTTRCSNG